MPTAMKGGFYFVRGRLNRSCHFENDTFSVKEERSKIRARRREERERKSEKGKRSEEDA